MLSRLVFLFLISGASFGIVCAQEISDRVNDDIRGYVKSVREESAEVIFRNGKPVEQKRQLESIKTYDISGKYLTEYVYSNDGKVLYGDTYHYDPEGKLVEKVTEHSKFTYLCDKEMYSYDEANRPIEEICYLNGKGPIGKYVIRYDDKGRLAEKERIPIVVDRLYFSENTLERYTYDQNGRCLNRTSFIKVDGGWKPMASAQDEFSIHSYQNDESNVYTSLKYDIAGALKEIEVSQNDQFGNELETITYFPDGTLKGGNRYTYEFDKNNNPIRETDSEWTTLDGHSSFRLSEVTYRKFEYYSDREIANFKAGQAKLPQKRTAEKTTPQSDAIDPEEYEVYKVLAEDWFKDSRIEHVVFDRFTGVHNAVEDTNGPPMIPGVDKELSANFWSKNWRKNSELRLDAFGTLPKLVLINQSEEDEIFRDQNKGWKYFYEKYPKSQGITTVSRVGFNNTKTRAVVYFGTQSDWLAGAGYWVILTKASTGWTVASSQMIWIS